MSLPICIYGFTSAKYSKGSHQSLLYMLDMVSQQLFESEDFPPWLKSYNALPANFRHTSPMIPWKTSCPLWNTTHRITLLRQVSWLFLIKVHNLIPFLFSTAFLRNAPVREAERLSLSVTLWEQLITEYNSITLRLRNIDKYLLLEDALWSTSTRGTLTGNLYLL